MSAFLTSTSSQWDIDVPEDVFHQAVENFGNFLSKEEMSDMVEKRQLQKTWHGWRQTASGPTMSGSL